MISKDDFNRLLNYYILIGKCSAAVDREEKYKGFVERREDSDFIMQMASEDARYDAEMDLVEEILFGEEIEYV